MKLFNSTFFASLNKSAFGRRLLQKFSGKTFPGSESYWEERYKNNGNSGNGSYGENAKYKADFINHFVIKNNINRVIELGCGDGNQLKYFNFPFYIGLDVSPTIIEKCKEVFKDDTKKEFYVIPQNENFEILNNLNSDLTLSLDVIYHLVEDSVFEKYMHLLFSASSKFVIIYAWDVESEIKFHVRHRKFTNWIDNNISGFVLKEDIKSEKFCDFIVYEKKSN